MTERWIRRFQDPWFEGNTQKLKYVFVHMRTTSCELSSSVTDVIAIIYSKVSLSAVHCWWHTNLNLAFISLYQAYDSMNYENLCSLGYSSAYFVKCQHFRWLFDSYIGHIKCSSISHTFLFWRVFKTVNCLLYIQSTFYKSTTKSHNT